MTDRCKNITIPQLCWLVVNIVYMWWFMSARRFPCLGCIAMVVKPAWAWLLTIGRSTLLHNVLQMAAPRVAIWLPPSNGGQHLHGRCACMPHAKFL